MSSLQTPDPSSNVREDPGLAPCEKGFLVRVEKDSEAATVYTEIAGLTRRLLNHPLFETHMLRISGDEEFGRRIAPAEYQGGDVTGVEGTVPLGAVKIRSSARNEPGFAEVVSHASTHSGGDA